METQTDKFTYEQAVEYIESIPKFAKKNKPENTWELLKRLGYPQREMKVIHVAGTNGKGSVCAFLASILTRAGKKTGLFTSPHLVEITERIVIQGEQVGREAFAGAFARVKRAVDEMEKDGFYHPAYFELLFAVGLLLFREARVEYLVLETGLGGRLDATNLVEHPAVTVITTIGMDHMEYLGNTLEKIAWEKAGIIKEGVPVVYDARNEATAAVIRQEAQKKHAPQYACDASMWRICSKTDKSIDFILNNRYYERMRVTVPYLAEYQVVNSTLALTALRALDPEKEISDETAAAGILNTRWAGRMETVLPGVVLDGAHNEDGIRELIHTVKSVRERMPVSLLFSAVSDKEHEKMIETVCQAVDLSFVVVTEVGGYRQVPAAKLGREFSRHTKAPVYVETDVEKAFKKALKQRGESMLFCAGSLYLVGEIKSVLLKMRRGE